MNLQIYLFNTNNNSLIGSHAFISYKLVLGINYKITRSESDQIDNQVKTIKLYFAEVLLVFITVY